MDKKKNNVWLPLMISISMVAGIFLGYKMRDEIPGKGFFHIEKRNALREILDLIENKYVDTVNLDRLSDTAIQAILSQLDPHSVYIPASELTFVNEDMAGNFVGIGIEFNVIDDSINVINVIKDGPSDKAGLQPGDRLIKADGKNLVAKKPDTDSIRMILRGPAGSTVDITLIREGKPLNVSIKRDVIQMTSVDAAYMLDSSIGYIRLNRFSQQTYREFMISLEALKKAGMKKLVFDLRGNGGGILEEAVEIADEFLDGDKLITYTIGRHYPRKEYRCRREGQFENGQLVVLIDEGTASASEVLTGALQDWDRAIIIGRRSFGKGLVQDQFDLSDKSAVRLTIARYYTPIGRSIQRPYTKGGKAYYEEVYNRFTDGEIFTADSLKNDSSLLYKTAAGKKVFGGGGISPEYFIPADSGTLSHRLSAVFNGPLLFDYEYKYFLSHRQMLKNYTTPEKFADSFFISNDDRKYFENLAAADSIRIDSLNEKEKDYLFGIIRSSIARQLWRNEGYFKVSNRKDKTILKAMELLRNN